MMKKSTAAAFVGAFALSFGAVAAGALAGDYGKKSKMEAADVQTEAQPKAVLIYADWCGSCQILDPRIKSVKESGGFENVDYVVLDYTARDEDAFYKAAKKAGVKKAVHAAFDGKSVKTGQLFLINAEGTEILATVTRKHSEEDIAEAVAALQKASA